MYGYTKAVRRVDKIVERILTDHAVKCLEVYPEVFSQKKQELGELVYNRVEEMIGNTIKEDLLSPAHRHHYTEINSQNLSDEYGKDYDNSPLSIRNFVCLKSALRPALAKKLLLGAHNGGSQLSGKNRIKELIEEYVMTPCWLYESEVAHFRRAKSLPTQGFVYSGWVRCENLQQGLLSGLGLLQDLQGDTG